MQKFVIFAHSFDTKFQYHTIVCDYGKCEHSTEKVKIPETVRLLLCATGLQNGYQHHNTFYI